ECSRLSEVVRSEMNWSNKSRGLFDEEWLDQVFVVETSLRWVEYGKTYSERLEIVNGVKSMDLRRMRTTRNSHR
ncbi:hypothetical protein A2U01_0097752, partial [Trifolium medium]|nr:hypothetical protein [Trifolium medium]